MTNLSSDNHVLPGWMRRWEDFWFTPADPTVLALIRMACGSILVYMLVVYSFNLQDLMGAHAWSDLEYRMQAVRDRLVIAGPLTLDRPVLNSTRPEDIAYVQRYQARWHLLPPAYVKDADEANAIDEFQEREGIDPRLVYDRGMRIFSLWFHVTDPTAMAVLHGLILTAAFCFTIGLYTRFAMAVTWFGFLCYVHRNPNILFGADQMTTLILLYLMISPCGSVYSVDRLVQRWWHKRRPGAASLPQEPQPSISANVAIRLLQVQVGIIYLAAGLAKLAGNLWWDGTAVWYTISCYEFAPMRNEYYMDFLRYLAGSPLAFAVIVTGGGYFTLVFEITYIFLIWQPRFRWMFIASAVLLHGLIGFLMGLTTFSWLILAMNLAFLRKEEANWVLGGFGQFQSRARSAFAE